MIKFKIKAFSNLNLAIITDNPLFFARTSADNPSFVKYFSIK